MFEVTGWVFMGALLFGVVATILMIGVERKPTTPGVAVASMLFSGALLVWIWAAMHR